MKHTACLQRGVSMIEVLVALLVLSIGLLGVAATVAKSSRFAAGAWAQSAVVNSLSDIAERLRSSPNSSNANFTLTANYAMQRADIDAGTVVVVTDCETVACIPAQAAAFHIATWRQEIERTLPGAAGWISPLSSAATESRATSFELAVMWFDKSNTDGSGTANAALVCTGAETGIEQRRCCPVATNAAAGVRCTRMVLVP